MEELTERQRIVAELAKGPMSAKDLSRAIGIKEKEVLKHLPHVQKSVESKGQWFKVVSPECLKCGFVFKKRERLTTPGKCPLCRSEEITEARYYIE